MEKREIKFRLWNKEFRKMIYKGDEEGVDFLDGNELYGYWDEWWGSQVGVIFDAIGEMQEDYIPMQFTGLLDKNGKEIYCGDIVKGYFDTNKVEDCIWLSLTDEEKKNDWKLFKIDMDIVEFARQQLPEELEIIGNVMENPNLLSEKEE